MSIKIVNIKKEPCDVYCGRSRKGQPQNPLGNPFEMPKHGTRDEVCDKFDKYFRNLVIIKDETTMEALRNIYRIHQRKGSVTLGCFCAPKRCHCETIRDVLIELTTKTTDVNPQSKSI